MSTPTRPPFVVLGDYLDRRKEKAKLVAKLEAMDQADVRDEAELAILVPEGAQRRFQIGATYSPKFVYVYRSPVGLVVETEEYEVIEQLGWPEPKAAPAPLEARGSVAKPEDDEPTTEFATEYRDDAPHEAFALPVASLIDSEVS